MVKDAERIERNVTRLRKTCLVLKGILSILIMLCLLIAFWTTLLVVERIKRGAAWSSWGILSWGEHSFHLVPALIWFGILLSLFVILWRIVDDVAHGISPFTSVHAKRIRLLGVLFLCAAVSGMVFQGSVQLDLKFAMLIYHPNPVVLRIGGQGGLCIDMGSILMAVACFAISNMWQYASLLQRQTEDLI